MKCRCRTTAKFIFVIYFAIFSSGCMTVGSYRVYDPDLDSAAISETIEVALKDGSAIKLDDNSDVRIIENAQLQRALRLKYSVTLWDESHRSYTVTEKTDTISFDKIREIRVEEFDGGATAAVVFGSILGATTIILVILAAYSLGSHKW